MPVEDQGGAPPAADRGPHPEPKNGPPFTNPTHGHGSMHLVPPAPTPVDKGRLAAQWAQALEASLRGKLIYSENAGRSQLFDRVKAGLATGQTQAQIISGLGFGPPEADCSQFVATCEMAAGHSQYNDRDYTGTELHEGALIADLTLARPGDYVIYGPGTGEHTDMLIVRTSNDWRIVGFGHQGGPDAGLLSGSMQWFAAHGHPGVRILRPA